MSTLRVERRFFPRPSEPQFGWIGATLSAPSFNANLYPAMAQEANSAPAVRQTRIQGLYQDQPQLSWLSTPLTLWEVPYGAASEAERQSFRASDPKTDKTYLRQDPPELSWLTPVLNLWEVTRTAALMELSQSYRAAERQSDKVFVRQDQPAIAWLKDLLSLWEVTYGVPGHAQEQSVRAAEAQRDKTLIQQDQPSLAWIYSAVPPPTTIDPQLWPAIEELTRGYRTADRISDKTLLRQDTPKVDWLRALTLWEVTYGVPAHAQEHSYRSLERQTDKVLIRQDQPQFSWLWQQLGLWEVQYGVAAHAQEQAYRAADPKTDKVYLRQDQPELSWLSTVLGLLEIPHLAAVLQELGSFRLAHQAKASPLNQPQDGWNPTAITPPSPWLTPYIAASLAQTLSFRSPEAERELLRRLAWDLFLAAEMLPAGTVIAGPYLIAAQQLYAAGVALADIFSSGLEKGEVK